MRKHEQGFMSIIAILIVVILIGIIGFIVYRHYAARNTTTSQSSQMEATTNQVPQQYATPTGTTDGISNLLTQEDSNQAAINTRHSAIDQSNAQSANNAAANLGGAYNESSF